MSKPSTTQIADRYRWKLRRARERRNWSYETAVEQVERTADAKGIHPELLGVDSRLFIRWETGEVTPRKLNVWLLSQTFELPPEELDLPPLPIEFVPPNASIGQVTSPQLPSGGRPHSGQQMLVYPARELIGRSRWNGIIESANTEVWLYGMAEFRYAFDPDVPVILKRNAAAGCSIRILLLHPDYPGTIQLDSEEGNPPGALSTRIRKSLEQFEQMKAECGELMEIRTYAASPTTSIVRGDDKLIVTPYVRYFAGRSSPTMELRRTTDPQMFDRYTQHFVSIWSAAKEWQG